MRPLLPKPPVSSPTTASGSEHGGIYGSSTASSGPNSAYTPSTPGTDVFLADNLESVTRAIVDSFNDRDYTNPIIVANIATDFCFESDYVQACSTLEDYLNMCRAMDAMYPKYHLHILDMTTEIVKNNEEVEILITFEITGAPENVKRQRMSVCKWIRESDRWLWQRHLSMRMPATEFPEPSG